MCECKIVPKRIKDIEIRLFEEEIDLVQFLCFLYDLSYEQLLVKLTREHIEQKVFNNKNYEFNL